MRPSSSASQANPSRGAKRVLLGRSRLPVPADLGRGHPRDRDQRQQRVRRRRDVAGGVAGNDVAPARRRHVDRREAVVDVAHVLVDLVAQPDVEGQVVADPPVVLRVEMQPVGAGILAPAPADARARLDRVAEQEVGERVPAEPAGVAEAAAGRVRVLGPETEMEPVAAELQAMRAAVDQKVVVELEVLVAPEDEAGRIAHRAVEPGGVDLRVADVARIAGHAEQPGGLCEIDAAVQALLAAVDAHPPEARLVEHRCADRPRVARGEVARPGREGAPETRNQRLLLHAGAERLQVVRIEGAEPEEHPVVHAEAVIDAGAELIDVGLERLDRGQVLHLAGAGVR